MSYNYLIVEDNPGSVKNLQIALKPHKDFSAVGVATTLTKGISMALSTRPHLIFLDVELGEENGFDLIKEIRQHSSVFPFIIMITDYERYAKKAVNTDVLYFLDKPIDPDELITALHKFEERVLELKNHITIKNSEGHFFIDLNTIQYIKSETRPNGTLGCDDRSLAVSARVTRLPCLDRGPRRRRPAGRERGRGRHRRPCSRPRGCGVRRRRVDRSRLPNTP